MEESGFSLWALTIVVGPIILGCVIAYALLTRRRLSRREKDAQQAQVREAYHKTPDEPASR